MQTIKVEMASGIRGGLKVASYEAQVITFKNGNKRAVVPAGKRGGKVVVYCSGKNRLFRPKAAKAAKAAS
jgi:hypothetical protein